MSFCIIITLHLNAPKRIFEVVVKDALNVISLRLQDHFHQIIVGRTICFHVCHAVPVSKYRLRADLCAGQKQQKAQDVFHVPEGRQKSCLFCVPEISVIIRTTASTSPGVAAFRVQRLFSSAFPVYRVIFYHGPGQSPF